MSNIYFLKKTRWIPWGYEQYPQDNSTVFKYLFQMARDDEQIMICRKEDNLYYAYVCLLGNGERIGIGIVSDVIITDYYDLLRTFRNILKQISDEELIIVKNSKSQMLLSKDSFKEKHVYLDIFIRTHKLKIIGESIPVAEIDVPKDDIVRCRLGKKASSWIVEQIKAGYHQVFITVEPLSKKKPVFQKYGKMIFVLFLVLIVGFSYFWWNHSSESIHEESIVKEKKDTTRTVKKHIVMPDVIINNKEITIPHNFVSVPSGILKRYLDHYDDNYNNVYRDSTADSFYICKYEVIQKDYIALMGNNPSKYQGDSLPVHGMSVRDAVIYCNKKSEAKGLRGFYEIKGNVVTLKSDGNGYRLPTEKEWVLASKKTKEITHEKPFPSRPHAQDVRTYDFKPHTVGEIQDKRRELFDVYGNVSELCVRSNGEIWGKGGSYRIALGSETSENGGLKAAENLSSTIHLNADFGLRLVFIP